MKTKIATLIVFLVGLIYSCKEDNQTPEIPTYQMSQETIDGISYKCITIGGQVWMAENLKTRLAGGRSEGSMTFDEPVYTEATTESRDTRDKISPKLVKMLEDGFFNSDPETQANCAYLINEEIIPDFFSPTGTSRNRPWTTYSNLFRIYPWNDELLPYFELIEAEILRLLKEERNLSIFAAANQNYIKDHGYLYTFEASQKVIPAGWRIPTDEDWMHLERALGMKEEDVQKTDEWRGSIGELLKSNSAAENFNASFGGAYIYGLSEHSDNFINKEIRGYWWTSTKDVSASSDSTYFIRALRFDNDQMLRATTRLGTAYSLRLVKNK